MSCDRRNGRQIIENQVDYYDRSSEKMTLTERQLEILVEPKNVTKNLYFWKHYG